MKMNFIKKLALPVEVKEMCPLTGKMGDLVDKKKAELEEVFAGRSDKLILIIGPCSADREDSVIDYISRLCPIQEKVKDKIIIVPRIYTNKPRTTGSGYKGIVHQPDPQKEVDFLAGLVAMRHMHIRAVEETGLTAADEMLYPENHKHTDTKQGGTIMAQFQVSTAKLAEEAQHLKRLKLHTKKFYQ